MAINRTRPSGNSGLKVEVERPVVGDTSTPAAPAATAAPAAVPRPPAPRQAEAGPVPRYLEMQRVDGRIRPDQSEDLAALRRRIARGRADRSERITDNTLLRVAVDLLLAHAGNLTGDTEDDMVASVLTEDQLRERNSHKARYA